MPLSSPIRLRWLGLSLLASLFASSTALPAPDNPPPGDTVGAIEGDAISVEGPMTVEVVQGHVRTVLRSGSDIRVKSGSARIDLVEGGTLLICGPAHLSVLKSGGALTVALDSGTIRARVDAALSINIYTPQILAHAVPIGGGPLDNFIGLDSSGTMCIRATKGAVRVEQQLTGQTILVPQNGDVSLTNGQIESLHTTAGHCVCEPTATLAATRTEVSALASTEELRKRAAEKKPAPPPTDAPAAEKQEEPVYQVFMPPLRYDANAKVQATYDPNLVVLVRRVRVRPTLIYQGKVDGDPIVAQTAPPPSAPKPAATAAQKPADDTTWNRVRTFFRKMWSPSS